MLWVVTKIKTLIFAIKSSPGSATVRLPHKFPIHAYHAAAPLRNGKSAFLCSAFFVVKFFIWKFSVPFRLLPTTLNTFMAHSYMCARMCERQLACTWWNNRKITFKLAIIACQLHLTAEKFISIDLISFEIHPSRVICR